MGYSPKDTSNQYPDPYHDTYSKTLFGFWVYLLTDFMLFATYFAVYVVLQKNTFGGPPAKEIFNLIHGLSQTVILLLCSFTTGCAGVFAHRNHKKGVIALFLITFVLGIFFLVIQFCDYTHLVASGNSWHRSAFLTSYFNLLALHSVHMIFALLWIIVFLIPVWTDGITKTSLRRLTCLRIFWQFLTIVWVFIFTIVYLGGALI